MIKTIIMTFIGKTLLYLWCLLLFGVYGEASQRSKGDQPCVFSRVTFHQCAENETCVKINTEAYCHCKPGFERSSNDSCLQAHSEPNPKPAPNISIPSESGGFGFKVVLWLIIPVLLACAIAGIVYTGRQKMWLNRLYRMRIRSYNNVLVSSQDEDDPPIA